MQTRIRLRSFFAAVAVTLGSLLVPSSSTSSAALAASPIYIVNDGGADCGPFVTGYSDIPTAVQAAITNGVKTILVCPGTYSNFSVGNAKNLTIKAALPGTFPTVSPPVSTTGIIVDVEDSSGVVLDGLNIDGTNFTDALTHLTIGVLFLNASGTVQNSRITKVRCYPNGCNSGAGIYLQDDNGDGKPSTLIVKNVDISDFDAMGIFASGPTKLTVIGSSLTGNFSGGTGVSPFGVTFGQIGATGSVTKSTISNVGYGVEIDGASKVSVSGNTINDAGYGVSLSTVCITDEQVANSNKVTGNIMSGITSTGVYFNSSIGGCTHTDLNTISGNRISGASGSNAGVSFSVATGGSANENKITSNAIFGFATDIITDPDATKTSISKNTWIP